MEIYKLRFSFDPDSGICLWSENELARDRFGYPVELDSLEIAPSVKKRAEELITRFDTSLDWSDPAGPSLWSGLEREHFLADAAGLLRSLQECLGAGFEIQDCSR
ncbi:hypothetical protein [Pseudoduganella violaceinigra]|uniref:hypothetical protein n=1 Tax=Pseudoduganella violaceinigra TaxID=246602 RepID=UPI0012B53F11|nr:hypothetical protein [Pseudoduganella violaceinigra]